LLIAVIISVYCNIEITNILDIGKQKQKRSILHT